MTSAELMAAVTDVLKDWNKGTPRRLTAEEEVLVDKFLGMADTDASTLRKFLWASLALSVLIEAREVDG